MRFAASSGSFTATSIRGSQELLNTRSLQLPKEYSVTSSKETTAEYIDKINLREDFKDLWDRKHGEAHPYSVLNKKRVQTNNHRVNERCRTEQTKLEREYRFLTNQQMSLKKNKSEDSKIQKKSEFLLSDTHNKKRVEFWKNKAKEFYIEAKKNQQKLTDLVKKEYNLNWLLVENNFDVIAELNDSIKINKKDIKEKKEKEKKNENPNVKEKLQQEITDLTEKTVRLERCAEEFKATKFKKLRTEGEALTAKFTDEDVGEKPSLEKLNKEARSNRELALTRSLDELHNLKMAIFCLNKLHDETIQAGHKRASISERAKLLNHRTHIIGSLFDVEWIYPETKDVTQHALNEIIQAAQSLKSTKDTIVAQHSADRVDLDQAEQNIGAVREQKAFIDTKVHELDQTSESVVLSDNEKQIIQDVQGIQYEAHDKAEAAEADYEEIQFQLANIAYETQSTELAQLSESLSKLLIRSQALLDEALNLSNQLATSHHASLADAEHALAGCREKLVVLMNEYQDVTDSMEGNVTSESLLEMCSGIEASTAQVLQCLDRALDSLVARKLTASLQQFNDKLKITAENAEKSVQNLKIASTLEKAQLELEACNVETQRAKELLGQASEQTGNISLTSEQKALLDEINTNKIRVDKAFEVAQAEMQKKYHNAGLTSYLMTLQNDTTEACLTAEAAATKAQAENTDIEQAQIALALCQSALTSITQIQTQAQGKTQHVSLSENQSQLLFAIEANRLKVSGFVEMAQAALVVKRNLVKLTLRLTTLKNESNRAAGNAERAAQITKDSNTTETAQAALETCQQAAGQAAVAKKIANKITQNVKLTSDQRKLLDEIHADKTRTDNAFEVAKAEVKKKRESGLTTRLQQLQNDTIKARKSAEAAALSAQSVNTNIKQALADVSTCHAALNAVTQIQTQAANDTLEAQLTENQSQLIAAIETDKAEIKKALNMARAALEAKQSLATLITHLLNLKHESKRAADSAGRALSLIHPASTEEELLAAIETCAKFFDETNKLSNQAKSAMLDAKPTFEQQTILAEIEGNQVRAQGTLAAAKARLVAFREEFREVSMYQAVINTLYFHLDQIAQDLKPNFLAIYTSIIDQSGSMRSTQFASLAQHFSFAKFAERNKAVKIGSEYTVNSNLDRRSNLTQFINVYQKYYPEFYVRPDLMSQEALNYATNIIQMNMVRLLSGKPLVPQGQKPPDLDEAKAADGVFTRGHIAKAVELAGTDLKQILLQEVLVVLDKAARADKCKVKVAQVFNLEPLDNLSSDDLKKIFLSTDSASKEILLNNEAIEKLKIIMDEQKDEYKWGGITEKNIVQAKNLLKTENSLLVKELEARAIMYGVALTEKQLAQKREVYQQKALTDTMKKEAEKGLAIIETALAEINDNPNTTENQKQEKRAPFEKMRQTLQKSSYS